MIGRIRGLLCAAFFCGVAMAAAPASAGTFFYCVVQDYNGRESRFVSDLREAEADRIDTMNTGFAYSDQIVPLWNRAFPGDASRKSYCSSSTNRAYIEKERAQLLANNPGARQVAFTRSPVASTPAKPQTGLVISMPTTTKPSGSTKEDSNKTSVSAADAERARTAERDRREAEFQAKMAAHEKGVADYNRKVAEREAEIARQKEELAANAAAAAREKAAYEAKLEAHRRQVEEANRRQLDYFDAQRRRALCISGDRKACEAPQSQELADASKPETSDDDARQCVASPVVSGTSIKGQMQAVIINGCTKAVDVRVCLMRTGGWNCGVNWGLAPQSKWSHSSFETQGQIYWDARFSGTNRPLGSPGAN